MKKEREKDKNKKRKKKTREEEKNIYIKYNVWHHDQQTSTAGRGVPNQKFKLV